MVRSFPVLFRRTANLGFTLGVVVLERLRTRLDHPLCLPVFTEVLPPGHDIPVCNWMLDRRRWVRVEDGSPTLDRRRALLVGTATLGLR